MYDEKNRLILRELKRNSRDSTAHISRRTHIPRVTVHERIRRMKEKGVIKRFTVMPDYRLIGLSTTAFVLVSYDPHSKPTQRQLAEKIAKIPNIYEVHILAGEWDMLLKVRAKSIEHVGKLVVDRLRETEGIGKTVTIPCFETIKEEP
ncbi:MAG: Lrp/AsnC family transcriptional regulator [Candidatus Micrarchaeota archaeon]